MLDKNRTGEFAEGKRRLEEMGSKLGDLLGKSADGTAGGASGILSGLGSLLDQVGKLVEQSGGTLHKSGEMNFGQDRPVKGVYGFTIKSALGEAGGVKVEPFGNIKSDKEGKLVEVQHIREPMIDVFDEADYLLVVAEVPGITQEDVKLELQDDILTFSAEKDECKYRKEVLLPNVFSSGQMSYTCRNGLLEVMFSKQS